MIKIVGIDLGTTNSVISVLEGSVPIIIPNAEGFRTTPSIVAYNEYGDILIGNLAKRQNVVNSENTFYSVKRFIGRKYLEIEKEISYVSYKLKPDKEGNILLTCPALKKEFHPEEISSSVLKKLTNDAGKFLNEEIKKAVITVPAYFNDSQRLATKDAGSIAGLDVLRIINEPTAAALAYGLNKKKNEIILIFDLGGGTLDVSILEVGEDVFEVLATAGDTYLGGDDFDKAIAKYIVDEFMKKEGIDLSLDKQALQRIIDASEKAKIELSSAKTATINIPFVYFDIEKKQPKNIDLVLTRSKFEELLSTFLIKCKEPIEIVLKDSKLKKENIDEIVLVGGSTRIPCIKSLLNKVLNKPLNESVNPDEVVALGAAIQAGILAGELKDLILLDVTPLSLGVETVGELMTIIIPRNTKVPVSQAEIFSTSSDNQTCVEINVLQGERTFAHDNKSLGIFKLEGIPEQPKGIPQIEVKFLLNSEGILSVIARDQNSGIQQSIEIIGASTLGKEEVEKIINDAQKNSRSDSFEKKIIKIYNKIDFFINICENLKNIKSKKYKILAFLKILKNVFLIKMFYLLKKNIYML
jgi:molecular chaperone DnaK